MLIDIRMPKGESLEGTHQKAQSFINYISGLFFSTVMTLVVVPAFFTVLAKWKEKQIVSAYDLGKAV